MLYTDFTSSNFVWIAAVISSFLHATDVDYGDRNDYANYWDTLASFLQIISAIAASHRNWNSIKYHWDAVHAFPHNKIPGRLRDRCHAHQSHDVYAAPCRRSLSTLNCSILRSDGPRDLSAVACFDAWAFMSRAAISVFVYAISSPQHWLCPCFMLFISWANITEVVTCMYWRGSEYRRLPIGIETWIQASHGWQENNM